MSEFTHNKTSSYFVTLLIGIIVLSFMFTGYQAFENGGSSNSVAKVGDYNITPQEYQQEYNRQIEFFKQMFGGEISSKQMEALKIKESILRNLVQRKLLLKLAEDVGAFPIEEIVKSEIKSLPYFKSGDSFDIEKYKALLANNGLTPTDFEKDIANQLQIRLMTELNPEMPLSKNYLEDIQKFKNDKLSADVITFSKDTIRNFVNVSDNEISKYLAIETNKNRVLSMFNEKKAGLDKPEQVTASHILIKSEGRSDADAQKEIQKIAKEVTPLNFKKLADKYTEDPSGKGKGGSLGTFGKGAMVPEFDNVAFSLKVGAVSSAVKTNFGYHLIYVENKQAESKANFEDYKLKLTKEMIQKEKVEEIKKLTVDLSNNLKKALEANNDSEVKKLLDQYKLNKKKADINKIDGISTGENLSATNMSELFSGDLSKGKVILNDDGNKITMIRTYPKSETSKLEVDQAKTLEKSSEEGQGLKNVLSRKMLDGIIKNLEKDTKVKVFGNYLQE